MYGLLAKRSEWSSANFKAYATNCAVHVPVVGTEKEERSSDSCTQHTILDPSIRPKSSDRGSGGKAQ